MRILMGLFNHKLFLCLVLMTLGHATSVFAHEYWIEPRLFEISPGDTIEADLRNGQNFKGNMLYYLTHRFTKFEVYDGETTHKATGSNGDQPALKFETRKPGLHILAYQSVFDTLTFEKWEKFKNYLENQGLEEFIARHKARRLPLTMFNESYARNIKALVRVGKGNGSDRRVGLPFEFVAQENPYTMGADPQAQDFLTVRLYLGDIPMPGKQVLIFRNNGEITETKTITDARGYAKIPLNGGGKFMLSAVYMFDGDNDPATKEPEWYSLWANLIFGLPGVDAILKKPIAR